jgi:glutathione S-transferase
MGNGRYAAKLNDKDWETFNNYQRAHYNYIEGITLIATVTLVSGLWYPRFAVIAGIIYMIGRELYAFGYRTGGAKARTIGIIPLDLSLFALIGAAFYGAFNAGGGVEGLMKLLTA